LPSSSVSATLKSLEPVMFPIRYSRSFIIE
jgi:hypothetical protein